MNKIIYYVGLDVHKNSIAVAIAVGDGGELPSYGTIGLQHHHLRTARTE